MATNNAINNKTVDASLFIGNTAASSSSSYLEFRKSRSGGVITSGDGLGNISFAAYDGSNYITTSQILSFSGGTIAANRIASNLQFFTHPDSTNPSTLRMAISSTGTVTILSPDNAASTLELNGNQVAQILNMTQSVAGGTGAILQLIKNRSGGVITSGDTLGEIRFFGNDGSSNIQGSVIKSVSSGTIAANRVASNLQFFTHPDSTTASTLRMTIGAAGNVTIATPDSGVGLTVSGGGATITGTAVATQIAASGDTGGTASQNTITNATNTSLSSGTLSIKSTTTNNGNNAGFIKVYVGTTVAYIPYFTNIAP